MTSESASVAEPQRRRRGVLVFLRDMVVIIVIAALVSFVVKTFVVRSFYIPSGSMERTLLINDRILVDELTPRWAGYERGDVVVFRDPGDGCLHSRKVPPVRRWSKLRTGCSHSWGSRPRMRRTTSSSGSSGCRVIVSSAAMRWGR